MINTTLMMGFVKFSETGKSIVPITSEIIAPIKYKYDIAHLYCLKDFYKASKITQKS